MKPHLVSTKLGVLTLFLSCLASCAETPPPVATSNARLSAVQIDRVGRRIWQNECGGTVAGLTSWNVGEDFASLGIGHFIWYPQGQSGPFEESFPPLAAFLAARGHGVPGWMRGSCPWPTKPAFEADKNGARQQELRALLGRTVREQTEFIMERMERALPKMLAAAPAGKRAWVNLAFGSLKATPEGVFCLIDYVNFKGKEPAPRNAIRTRAWGLLQVLQEVGESPSSHIAWNVQFAEARETRSQPPGGKRTTGAQGTTLAGRWHNRCDGYKRSLWSVATRPSARS